MDQVGLFFLLLFFYYYYYFFLQQVLGQVPLGGLFPIPGPGSYTWIDFGAGPGPCTRKSFFFNQVLAQVPNQDFGQMQAMLYVVLSKYDCMVYLDF